MKDLLLEIEYCVYTVMRTKPISFHQKDTLGRWRIVHNRLLYERRGISNGPSHREESDPLFRIQIAQNKMGLCTPPAGEQSGSSNAQVN